MNWGYKILFVILLFVLAMCSMVFVAFRQTNEMMEGNYYQKEMQFQTIIDAGKNYKNAQQEISIADSANLIYFHFPTHLINRLQKGRIDFIRYSDQSKDFSETFSLENNGILKVDKQKFIKGKYLMKMYWTNDQVDYYNEDHIDIQ